MVTMIRMSNRMIKNCFLGLIMIIATILISGCDKLKPISFADRVTSLVASEGTLSPDFSTLVLFYDLRVGENVQSITLTPTLEGDNITVTVNDVSVVSGSPSQSITLPNERTEIRVDVVSETINYNYVVTVIKSKNFNAFLSDLTLSQGQLLPELEANTVSFTGYEATVSRTTSFINLTATLANSKASLTINGLDQISGEPSPNIFLDEGENAITIIVTAENQVTTQTYSLNIKRSLAEDFALYTYVKATNTDAGDTFGSSIATWGNTLVVGAPEEDSNATGIDGDQTDNSATGSGAVYVYEKDVSGSWQFKSYLKVNAEFFSSFGQRVAISNNRIVVSSHNVISGGTNFREYRKDGSNNWVAWSAPTSVSSLPPREPYLFGTDIVVSHNLLVIGVPGEQSSAIGINGDKNATFVNVNDSSAGAVYIFVGNPDIIGLFKTDSYIKASNTGAFDLFGYSIALSGNTLAVGAPGEESNARGINGNQLDNSAPDSGAVYIFTYAEGIGWAQQAFIKASNSEDGDGFGSSVALSGDTLVVGAPFEDGARDDQEANNRPESGAAYIFTRNELSSWSQQAYLKPVSTFNSLIGQFDSITDHFGSSLVLSGDTVVITSPTEALSRTGIVSSELRDALPYDGRQFQVGAASIFTRDQSNQWTEKFHIKAPVTDESDRFGSDVTVFGDQLVLSAQGEDSSAKFNEGGLSDDSANSAGAAYLYDNTPFSNHNLALSTFSGGSSNNSISAINIDTGLSLNSCTGNCNQLVARAQTIQLTPTVGSGSWEFVEWQGDEVCLTVTDTAGVISVPILAETFCTAVFHEVDISLTISKDVDSTADGELLATNGADTVANCAIGCNIDTSVPLALDSTIQITATAETGAIVAAWLGDAQCQSNANNLNTATTVSMSSSKTCTALFNLQETRTLSLMVNASGAASGSISVLNLSTSTVLDDCSTDCTSQIIRGHSIQLRPVATDGLSEFIEWTGDEECASNANGVGVTTVRLDDDIDCTAVFGEVVVEDIILTVSKGVDSSADGLIQASYNGDIVVSCDEGCISDTSAALVSGATIDLTAVPESGASVTAWTGGSECQANASADNTTTSTTITASKTCTAQFDFPVTNALRLTVINSSNSTGTISAKNSDTSIDLADCASDCSQQVISGQTVQLTPVAGNASEFSHWSGDTVCSQNVSGTGVTDVLMNADTLCTANFIEVVSGGITLTLSKTTDNTSLDGSMSAVPAFTDQQAIVTCIVGCTSATSATQLTGTEFDIFASPQDGFATIQEWTGDPQCAANASADKTSTRVTLTEAITCTVKFTAPL
jgi:hypothetical protein